MTQLIWCDTDKYTYYWYFSKLFYHICFKIACSQLKYCVIIINKLFNEDFLLRWILVLINVVFVWVVRSFMFFKIMFITHTHTHKYAQFWLFSECAPTFRQVSVNFPLNIRHYSLGASLLYTDTADEQEHIHITAITGSSLFNRTGLNTSKQHNPRLISFSKHQYVRSWSVALV